MRTTCCGDRARCRWQNLFYGAPLAAPAALSVAGLIGCAGVPSQQIIQLKRRVCQVVRQDARSLRSGFSLLGASAEAGLLHFRGAFHNPFMWVPVLVPTTAAAMLGLVAASGRYALRTATRVWLRFTAVIGFGGMGFHAFGVRAQMGGWRNWTQNVMDGPPLPAPPSFTALALAGLAALSLIEREQVSQLHGVEQR